MFYIIVLPVDVMNDDDDDNDDYYYLCRRSLRLMADLRSKKRMVSRR